MFGRLLFVIQPLKGKIPYQKFFYGKRKYALPEPFIDSIILYREE